MTIIEFYEELSRMLEKARDGKLSKTNAVTRLNQMIEEAKKSKIELDVNPDIFDFENLIKFDDERSYEEEEYSYESSYEEESEEEVDSSYDSEEGE